MNGREAWNPPQVPKARASAFSRADLCADVSRQGSFDTGRPTARGVEEGRKSFASKGLRVSWRLWEARLRAGIVEAKAIVSVPKG